MATWFTKFSPSCIITFYLSLQLAGITWGAYFTRKPPSLQYVLKGNNATFHWEYNVTSSQSLSLGQWMKVGSTAACISKSGNTVVIISNVLCQNFALEGQATLILKNVTKSLDGTYECDLRFIDTNPPGLPVLQNSASLLVVNKIPTFVSPTPNATVIEGSNSIVITVNVVGDYLPQITWYKNNALVNPTLYPTSSKEIPNSGNSDKMAQSNLTVLSPKRNINNNEFIAKATYGLHSPTSNTSVKLIIWYGPASLSIASADSGKGVSDGQSVTVTCTAVSNPPSTFTFFHNNSIILKNSASGVLTIPSFSRNDSGNYSCMAVNEVSNATVDGVWFLYAEPITTSSPTVMTPTSPGRTTAPGSDLQWWIWLIIALGILLLIIIAVLLICIIKRRRNGSKVPKSPKRFTEDFDISSYIKGTSYPNGYENHIEASVDEPRDVTMERGVDNPKTEEVQTNLGMKFESEHDLLEHIQRPGQYDDDVDFKDYDPFEEDETDGIEYRDPYAEVSDDPLAYDNNIFQEDDIVKVKSSSDREMDNEPELFTDLGEDIVQYDI